MDQYVKNSIDSRKNALFATYDVTDKGILDKIEKLFAEITKMGEESKDAMDFEAKFAASPLNQQYLDLFTEVATKCQPKTAAPAVDTTEIEKEIKQGVAAGVAESAADDVLRRVVPTRAAVHQKAYDAARDIPGVGDAMSVKQHLDFFGRFRKKED